MQIAGGTKEGGLGTPGGAGGFGAAAGAGSPRAPDPAVGLWSLRSPPRPAARRSRPGSRGAVRAPGAVPPRLARRARTRSRSRRGRGRGGGRGRVAARRWAPASAAPGAALRSPARVGSGARGRRLSAGPGPCAWGGLPGCRLAGIRREESAWRRRQRRRRERSPPGGGGPGKREGTWPRPAAPGRDRPQGFLCPPGVRSPSLAVPPLARLSARQPLCPGERPHLCLLLLGKRGELGNQGIPCPGVLTKAPPPSQIGPKKCCFHLLTASARHPPPPCKSRSAEVLGFSLLLDLPHPHPCPHPHWPAHNCWAEVEGKRGDCLRPSGLSTWSCNRSCFPLTAPFILPLISAQNQA
ncbi:collagen alpha-2(V) chain-like isoform X2 [Nycticebus coucang]|uniref:collagen alpha-2(V) chain-like isoform X2 n=1 Tax=Nycticebus coucang TaxID=9470 RepID=UPI00234D9346|nr:collagen alpha-2(V) chain-like isoform X2 [Nycticebus coucang]